MKSHMLISRAPSLENTIYLKWKPTCLHSLLRGSPILTYTTNAWMSSTRKHKTCSSNNTMDTNRFYTFINKLRIVYQYMKFTIRN